MAVYRRPGLAFVVGQGNLARSPSMGCCTGYGVVDGRSGRPSGYGVQGGGVDEALGGSASDLVLWSGGSWGGQVWADG